MPPVLVVCVVWCYLFYGVEVVGHGNAEVSITVHFHGRSSVWSRLVLLMVLLNKLVILPDSLVFHQSK